jgi:hypothetical protein
MPTDLWNQVAALLAAPFTGPVDLGQLALILGLAIIAAIVIALVLRHIELAATATVEV